MAHQEAELILQILLPVAEFSVELVFVGFVVAFHDSHISRSDNGISQKIFGKTFHLLGDDAQNVLFALSLFPSSASHMALSSILSLEESRLDYALAKLTDFGSITLNEQYRIVIDDAMRSYVRGIQFLGIENPIWFIDYDFEPHFAIQVVQLYETTSVIFPENLMHKFINYFSSIETELNMERDNLVQALLYICLLRRCK